MKQLENQLICHQNSWEQLLGELRQFHLMEYSHHDCPQIQDLRTMASKDICGRYGLTPEEFDTNVGLVNMYFARNDERRYRRHETVMQIVEEKGDLPNLLRPQGF